MSAGPVGVEKETVKYSQIYKDIVRFLSRANIRTKDFSIYTLSDLGVLSNLIGSLSLANEHYSPPTE